MNDNGIILFETPWSKLNNRCIRHLTFGKTSRFNIKDIQLKHKGKQHSAIPLIMFVKLCKNNDNLLFWDVQGFEKI